MSENEGGRKSWEWDEARIIEVRTKKESRREQRNCGRIASGIDFTASFFLAFSLFLPETRSRGRVERRVEDSDGIKLDL